LLFHAYARKCNEIFKRKEEEERTGAKVQPKKNRSYVSAYTTRKIVDIYNSNYMLL